MAAKSSDRVWFITGSSTGLGRVLAEQVLAAGHRVVATARNLSKVSDLERQYPTRAKAIRLDVTDRSEVEAAVAQAIAAFGRIDVLVNNAGYGLLAALEEASEQQIRRQIETNVYGVIYVTRAVLPHMRQQRSGHVINMSSVAGLVGTPGLGYYNATKFALEGLSEALELEASHLGIHVTAVEPGPFRTDFAGRSLEISSNEISDYAESSGRMRSALPSRIGGEKGDPVRAARAIQKIVESKNPPLHLILGAFARDKFRAKMQRFEKEMMQWEAVTLGSDFPEDHAQ
jgi:NAD(P)-dependent dehydrogenase (short-subunit alcohol dehydrogenase family)